ncbi:GPW/gp25 family protein [Novosphingobium sp. FSW06-99]|uniref:GPW/gp25 family protein n=1 Tax=Novosphingobium sp. FSW06-99 TaxID=1739113 RepID=UPI0009EC923D|nr:GPW/gp25 family protein [Novosphingobium sp. FSW06-99]
MSGGPTLRRPAAGGRDQPGPSASYPAFLGCGWSFPPTFVRPNATVVMAQGDVDIQQSLWILLSTGLTERIMLASYGCDLQSMVFTALTTTTANAIARMIGNAIIEWEPRITVGNIAVTGAPEEEGLLAITIDYRVIQTNTRNNLVFNYYTREATLSAPAG